MISPLLPLAFLAGVALAIALGINTKFGKDLRSPVAAGTLSFAIGTAVLTAAARLTGEPWPLWATLGSTSWASWAGGLFGATYLVATIALIPRLGVATTVGLQIAGQMLASLVLDHFGLLWVPVARLDLLGLCGGALALGGVGLMLYAGSSAGGGDSPDAPKSRAPSGHETALAAGALLIGVAPPIQGALNAHLRAEISAPLLSGAVSFAIGTVMLAAILTINRSRPDLQGVSQALWWVWFGGLFAAVYVCGVLLLVPIIGAAVTIGLAVVGQQLASLLIDHFGWLRHTRRLINPLRLAGVLIFLVGVTLIEVA